MASSIETTEHDYRDGFWGHALMEFKKADDGTYSCVGFGGVREGDTVLIRMQSGSDARWSVEKVRYYGDPPDMFEAVVRPVEYL